jgi:hypothetical protein
MDGADDTATLVICRRRVQKPLSCLERSWGVLIGAGYSGSVFSLHSGVLSCIIYVFV